MTRELFICSQPYGINPGRPKHLRPCPECDVYTEPPQCHHCGVPLKERRKRGERD